MIANPILTIDGVQYTLEIFYIADYKVLQLYNYE